MKGLTGVVNNSKTRLVKRKLGHSYAIFRVQLKNGLNL
jgi:hypothetical protein